MTLRTSAAFTLIEMLAAIAVIVILAGLLVTSVSSTRAKTLRSQCLSNQRQVYSALILYADDHGGRLPSAVTQEADKMYLLQEPKPWLQDVLIPYAGGAIGRLSGIFRCPAVRPSWLKNDPAANHYRYNARQAAGAKADQTAQPSLAVLLFDVAWPDWPRIELPHSGVQMVYADGHGAFLDADKFLSASSFAGDLQSPLMTHGW